MRGRRGANPILVFLLISAAAVILPSLIIVFNGPSPNPYFPFDAEEVLSADFSDDGRFALIGGGRESAWLHDLETNQIVQILGGHQNGASAVALSPDARRAATLDKDGRANWWDLETGARLDSIHRHTYKDGHASGRDRIGTNLAAAAGDAFFIKDGYGDLVLWEPAYGAERLIDRETSADEVRCLAASPDGSLLFAGFRAGRPSKLWNAESGELLRTFDFGADCFAAAFVPESNAIATGWGGNQIRILGLGTGKAEIELMHGNPVRSLAVSPDGRFLLAGGLQGNINLWDLEGYQLVQSFGSSPSGIMALAFPREQNTVLSMDRSGVVTLWDRHGGGVVWQMDGYKLTGDETIEPGERVIRPRRAIENENKRIAIAMKKPMEGAFRFEKASLSEVLEAFREASGLPLDLRDILQIRRSYGNGVHTAGQFMNEYFVHILDAHGFKFETEADGSVTVKPADGRPLPEGMDSRHIAGGPVSRQLEFKYIDMRDLLKQAGEASGIQFNREGDFRDPVTMELENPTPEEFLNAALAPQGLDYVIQDGNIRIGPREIILPVKRLQQDRQGIDLPAARALAMESGESISVDGIALHVLLDQLGSRMGVEFIEDYEKPVMAECALHRPTIQEILMTVLPPHGLSFALRPDGRVRVAPLESIARDGEAVFTPAMMNAFLAQYHSRFASAHLEYGGIVRQPGRSEGFEEYKRMQIERLEKSIEELRKLQNADSATLLTLSEGQLMRRNDSVQRLEGEIERLRKTALREEIPVRRVYSVRGGLRKYEEARGENEYDLAIWNGTAGFLLKPPAYAKSGVLGGFAQPEPRHPASLIRFGADMEWLVQRGYAIHRIDPQTRMIRLRLDDAYRENYYEFTLLDSHNAFWKRCEIVENGRHTATVECGDFIEREGMMIPQTVAISEHWPANGEAEREPQYIHTYRLEEARINQGAFPDGYFDVPAGGGAFQALRVQ